MSKSTPGPWQVENQRQKRIVGADSYQVIAYTARFSKYNNIPGEEASANAQLIAAAPDLLKATQAAWHLCESLLASQTPVGLSVAFIGPTPELIEEVRDACAAAIAKAEE